MNEYTCKTIKLLRLQQAEWTSQARHSLGKLKLSSSQTLLITQCPLKREEFKMWNIKYLHTIPLEEGRREGASFAFSEPRLRSFTICKQACIVLAGTSFATTGDLSPQRSIQHQANKDGGIGCSCLCFYYVLLSAQKVRINKGAVLFATKC